jgi:hypothetical protein
MSKRKRALMLTVAVAAALSLGAVAEARGRRGARPERIHARSQLAPASASSLRVARLDVSRQNLQRQSIHLQVTHAPAGQTLLVFVADAAGTMNPVGSMRAAGRSGRAAWNVKTARGDALPFGVPDVAFLSGRAIEVRSDAGDILLQGVLPTAAKATGISRRMKLLKQGLAVDPSASGVVAHVEFHRGEHGRPDRFAIRVDGEPAGLALEAWLQGSDGSFVKLGDLLENANESDDDDQADEFGDDDDDGPAAGDTSGSVSLRHLQAMSATETSDGDETDDDETTDGSTGSEYEFDLDGSAALPFGAVSLADLAGLTLEIRIATDQSVLASGILPDTSAPGDEADDDNEGSDGSDDDATDGGGDDD